MEGKGRRDDLDCNGRVVLRGEVWKRERVAKGRERPRGLEIVGRDNSTRSVRIKHEPRPGSPPTTQDN